LFELAGGGSNSRGGIREEDAMTLNFDPRAKAATLYHGEFRPMFIGGKWVAAQSGEVMQALNPATGEVLATVPRGGAADIDAAVAAARAAFEGPWSKILAL